MSLFFVVHFSVIAEDISKEIALMLLGGFNSVSIFIPDEHGKVYVTRTCDIPEKIHDMASGKGKVMLRDIGKETDQIVSQPTPDFLIGFLTAEQPYHLIIFCQKSVRYAYLFKVVEIYKKHFEHGNSKVEVDLRPPFRDVKEFQGN